MEMKANATGIQHLGIPTDNLEGTIAFYEKLGFEMIWRSGADCADKVAFLQLGSLVIETYYVDKPAKADGAIDHVALNVKDVEAAFSFCRKGGFDMLDQQVNFLPFFDKGVKFFTIRGINGEKVEFNQKL